MKKYAIVGTGSRAAMFYDAIATTYKNTCTIVGLCDQSETRMHYTHRQITKHGHADIPMYGYLDFEKMIDETKPDFVIVTSTDRTHHDYIVRAMEKGCDVITEKPMTIDEKKTKHIVDAIKRTGRDLRVTFNYRYAPNNTKIRELIMDGVIGDVFSVHFEWLLDTSHGADYYRRWHRNKHNSGGLLVHKSTHHFDLVNFWLGAEPENVFAFGDLNFYGRHNAEKRGMTAFTPRSHKSPIKDDPFAIDMEKNPTLKGLYLDAEKDSGYIRDRSVFSDDISIEDTMGVLVKYNTNAILTYSLNSYMPWEGFSVNLNGSKGRIEYKVVEKSYINAGGNRNDEGALKTKNIMVYPMFDAPYAVEVETKAGGHGGGDIVMLEDIFGDNPAPDKFKRAAGVKDGVMSIMTGICANKAIASGIPQNINLEAYFLTNS
ncbi:MAG: Gfo/Idh/MocA family oxidoreductase [Defluviitaleaceae bacterium]|nr:Gfo/Idh/MocA family oxidoreductase [Defluviitaleaceae bacterium]